MNLDQYLDSVVLKYAFISSTKHTESFTPSKEGSTPMLHFSIGTLGFKLMETSFYVRPKKPDYIRKIHVEKRI